MEKTIADLIVMFGAPGSVIVGGILLYRWASFRFDQLSDQYKEINTALNCKMDKDLCGERHGDSVRRLNRIEMMENGRIG